MPKLIFFTFALTLCLGAPAGAAPLDLARVNQELAGSLRKPGAGGGEARFVFSQLQADEQRVIGAEATGTYERRGRTNLRLDLDRVNYAYGDGSAPTTKFAGRLHVNLAQLFGPELVGAFLQSLEGTLHMLVRDAWARQYGNAMAFRVDSLSKGRREGAVYTGQKTRVNFTLDMNKLPAGKNADAIFARAGSLTFEVKSADEIAIEAEIVTNPAYRSLRAGERGLREMIAQLQGRDADTAAQLSAYVGSWEKMIAPYIDNLEAGFQP